MSFSYQAYKQESESFPVLNKQEEIDLLKSCKEGDVEAKQKLIQANIRLVFYTANQVKQKCWSANIDDLVQEGTIGLIKAIEKFDFNRGAKFSTYATYWIRHFMMAAFHKDSRNIRQPANIPYLSNAIEKYKSEYYIAHQEYPSAFHVVRKFNITEDCFERVQSSGNSSFSLSTPISDDGDLTIGDLVCDKNCKSVDEKIYETEIKYGIEKVLARLKGIESEYVRLYYGLNNEPALTYAEIGEKFNVTGESVRRTIRYAMKKLKAVKEIKLLLDYLQ